MVPKVRAEGVAEHPQPVQNGGRIIRVIGNKNRVQVVIIWIGSLIPQVRMIHEIASNDQVGKGDVLRAVIGTPDVNIHPVAIIKQAIVDDK